MHRCGYKLELYFLKNKPFINQINFRTFSMTEEIKRKKWQSTSAIEKYKINKEKSFIALW
jgi:hypothetical protein